MLIVFVRAAACVAQAIAMPMKVKRVACNVKVKNACRQILDLLNAWVAKLVHVATIGANEVIVLAKFMCAFEMR